MNRNTKGDKPEPEMLKELNQEGNIKRAFLYFYITMLCFFEKYLPRNYYYLEERTDDLFLKLHRNAQLNINNREKHFKTVAHLSGWLHRVAWNMVNGEYRGFKKPWGKLDRSIFPMGDKLNLEMADEDTTRNVKSAIDTFYDLGFEGCVEEMQPHYKEVLRCIFIEGYTLKETAEYLRINVKTVAEWLKKGIEFIIEKISDKIPPDHTKLSFRRRKDLKRKSGKNDKRKGEV